MQNRDFSHYSNFMIFPKLENSFLDNLTIIFHKVTLKEYSEIFPSRNFKPLLLLEVFL